MKILILSDSFPPSAPGGAERSTFDLADAFRKRGHKVFVITTVQDKKLCQQGDFKGLEVFRIYANYHARWRAYLSLYNPQTVGKVKAIMRQIRPDVVSAQIIHHYLSYSCLKLAKKYAKAVFLTARDMMLFHYGKMPAEQYLKRGHFRTNWLDHLRQGKKRYNPFRNIVIRHYLKYIDKIFAISNSLKEVLAQNGIENVGVVHNATNPAEWQENPQEVRDFKERYNIQNKKVILFGGRLSDTLKGGGLIVRAMKHIAQKVPEAILLVAGKKEAGQGMLALSQELGIENQIIFTGWLDRAQMRTAFFCSDVVSVPGIYVLTFNRFNMEGMAAKKPVVGTCFGAGPEVVKDNETGYIVNPFDIELMAQKIIDLLKNPAKAEQFGQAGFERVKQKFNLEKQVNKYLDWFNVKARQGLPLQAGPGDG